MTHLGNDMFLQSLCNIDFYNVFHILRFRGQIVVLPNCLLSNRTSSVSTECTDLLRFYLLRTYSNRTTAKDCTSR